PPFSVISGGSLRCPSGRRINGSSARRRLTDTRSLTNTGSPRTMARDRTMAHVTFVHGMANKPPADLMLQLWLRALARDDPKPEVHTPPDLGLDLGTLGVSVDSVYWRSEERRVGKEC